MVEKPYQIATNIIGRAGELRVASEVMLKGHMVYMPSIDNGRVATQNNWESDTVPLSTKQLSCSISARNTVDCFGNQVVGKYLFTGKSLSSKDGGGRKLLSRQIFPPLS